MNRIPGVSVVMASLDGDSHIEAQLQSIEAQSVQPIEIVINDDGSSDETVEIIRKFAESSSIKVDLRMNTQRLGYGENFMQAATRARGTLLAFADQDDVWLPDRLARATDAFGDPELMLWIGGWSKVDARLEVIQPLRVHSGFHARSAAAYPMYVMHGSRMVLRASLIDQLKTHPRPVSVCGHRPADHDEWAMFAAHALGQVTIESQTTMLYRRHPGASSASVPNVPSRMWMLARRGEPPSENVLVAALSRLDHLRQRRDEPDCFDSRDRLTKAVTYYEQLVPRLERRLRSRSAESRLSRARNVAAGMIVGDYHRLTHGGLGLWNLAQDLYCATVPPTKVNI